jgi:hypothetical protein
VFIERISSVDRNATVIHLNVEPTLIIVRLDEAQLIAHHSIEPFFFLLSSLDIRVNHFDVPNTIMLEVRQQSAIVALPLSLSVALPYARAHS